MNKQELTIVVLLFGLLLGWGYFNRHKPVPPTPALASDSGPAAAPAVGGDATLAAATTPVEAAVPPAAGAVVEAPAPSLWPAGERVILSNAWSRVSVDSHGGVVRWVELPSYRKAVAEDSGPMHLDFEETPALALTGIPGLDTQGQFALVESTATSVVVRAANADGLQFERSITLLDSYQIAVRDRFVNTSASEMVLPPQRWSLATMRMNEGESTMAGIVYLGLDTLAAEGGSRPEHWGKKLSGLFGIRGGFLGGCSRPNLTGVPLNATQAVDSPTDWVAVKNKYFVQILAPDAPADRCTLQAGRDPAAKALVVNAVGADLHYGFTRLAAGGEVERGAHYYVGPKKYDVLKTLGKYQHDIMQFGWWDWFRWLCSALLWALNGFHALIPNYGVAVILVTVVVRLFFWPITQKATSSMKKMQKVQPLVTQIREKHKDNPQKMNQEIMALYREHKVNPMSGCLPMVVQIPVFIALFVVLRSAIELRFAGFLWIHDLSEPERLLAGLLPIPLNILPLLMTATTVLQQKLTPSSADPQQQKIMMLMPVMFLFLFYNMASGLVLYWTVSQALAILQIVLQKRREDPVPTGPVVTTKAPAGKSRRYR